MKSAWIPLGSFALAVALALLAGPTRSAVARRAPMAATGDDVCHGPDEIEGKNGTAGFKNGVSMGDNPAPGQLNIAEDSSTFPGLGFPTVRTFGWKPTGSVRVFAGANDGLFEFAKEDNHSTRILKFIGKDDTDCCHKVTFRSNIKMMVTAKIERPKLVGDWGSVDVGIDIETTETADKCKASGPGFKRTNTEDMRLKAKRTLTEKGLDDDIKVHNGGVGRVPRFNNQNIFSDSATLFYYGHMSEYRRDARHAYKANNVASVVFAPQGAGAYGIGHVFIVVPGLGASQPGEPTGAAGNTYGLHCDDAKSYW